MRACFGLMACGDAIITMRLGGTRGSTACRQRFSRVKLRYLPKWNQQRRDLAARYDLLFENAGLTGTTIDEGIVLPFTESRAHHIFHQYVIRAPRRDELRQYLTDRKIGSEIYYPLPLHQQTSLANLGYEAGTFPRVRRRRMRCSRCRCIRSCAKTSRRRSSRRLRASTIEVADTVDLQRG